MCEPLIESHDLVCLKSRSEPHDTLTSHYNVIFMENISPSSHNLTKVLCKCNIIVVQVLESSRQCKPVRSLK